MRVVTSGPISELRHWPSPHNVLAETAQEEPLVRDEFAAVLVAAVNEPGWQTMAQRAGQGLESDG
jgi:hypothetical protein